MPTPSSDPCLKFYFLGFSRSNQYFKQGSCFRDIGLILQDALGAVWFVSLSQASVSFLLQVLDLDRDQGILHVFSTWFSCVFSAIRQCSASSTWRYLYDWWKAQVLWIFDSWEPTIFCLLSQVIDGQGVCLSLIRESSGDLPPSLHSNFLMRAYFLRSCYSLLICLSDPVQCLEALNRVAN